MNRRVAHAFPALLRADERKLWSLFDDGTPRDWPAWMLLILCGAGLFGATLGCWRAPLQGLFAAVKLPLLFLLTAMGNALLNGLLAPLLGVRFGVRQSLFAVTVSFAIAAGVLAALAPLLAFVVWNVPTDINASEAAWTGYHFMQLLTVAMIATAGVAANLRLLPLLRQRAGSERSARTVMLSWLAGNLLLGSQICWLLRPFVGRPEDPVTFLGPDPFESNFIEGVLFACRELLQRLLSTNA